MQAVLRLTDKVSQAGTALAMTAKSVQARASSPAPDLRGDAQRRVRFDTGNRADTPRSSVARGDRPAVASGRTAPPLVSGVTAGETGTAAAPPVGAAPAPLGRHTAATVAPASTPSRSA